MTEKSRSGDSVSYRKIRVQGTGIVIGDGSSVVIGQSPSPMPSELLRKLDEFLDLLANHEGSIEGASDVRESVMEVQREAAEASPRWAVVRILLGGIAASVNGVATLAGAINNILEVVGRISR
jgi:hypothetical protein